MPLFLPSSASLAFGLTAGLILLGLLPAAPRSDAQETPAPAPAAAAAPAGSVSFASGLYTFAEIAQSLSTPDHPVRCAASLKNFAAFVHLNARPRAKALRVLGAGLDVALLPDTGEAGQTSAPPPGGLVLTRDPQTAAREALWRRQFEAGVSAHLQRELKDFRARAAARPLIDIKLHNQRLQTHYRLEAESAAGTVTQSEIQRQRDELAEAFREEQKAPSAQERLCDVWLQNTRIPTLAQVLSQGGIQVTPWPVPREWQPVLGRAIAETEGSGFLNPEDPLALQSTVDSYLLLTSWQFRRGLGRLSFGPQAWLIPNTDTPPVPLPERAANTSENPADAGPTSGTPVAARVLQVEPVQLTSPAGFGLPGTIRVEGVLPENALSSVFEGTSPGVDPSYPGLGAEAVAWLKAEQAATREYLRTDAQANKPLKTPLDKTMRSVSDAVAAWCRDTDAEAVMELAPEAEVIYDNAQPPAATLAAWAAYRAARTQEGDGDCWSFRQEKGVLLVKDRMAFLDRLRPYPMVAFVPLARAHAERQQAALEAARLRAQPGKLPTKTLNLVDYDLLKPYVMAVSADSRMPRWRTGNRTFTPLLDGTYHGVDLERLDAAVVLVSAWEQLTERQQADLLLPLPSGRPVVRALPLSSLPPGARARLLDLLRTEGGGLDHPRLWGPQGREIFLRSLRLWAFAAVRPQPQTDSKDTPPLPAPPTYSVTLRIQYADDRLDQGEMNQLGSDTNAVSFRWTPKLADPPSGAALRGAIP